MKYALPLAAVTALLGFAAGWLAKPSPATSSLPPADPPSRQRDAAPPPGLSSPPVEPAPAPAPPQREDGPSPTPLDSVRRETAETLDEAKLLRLAEALSLTSEQQSSLLDLIRQSGSVAASDDLLESLTQRADFLDRSLETLLSASQKTELHALLRRSRENAIEVSAQRELFPILEQIDLSPQQREQALAALRETIQAGQSGYSPSLALVLEGTPLPLGGSLLPPASLSVLQPPSSPGSPPASGHADAIRPLLSPAQQAQFDAIHHQKRRILDRIHGLSR